MFQKLTSEEFDLFLIKGWGRSSPTYSAINGLRVGKVVIILKTQSRRNKAPSIAYPVIEKKWKE